VTTTETTAGTEHGGWGPLAEPIHDAPAEARPGGLPYRENAFVSWWDVERRAYGVGHFSTTPNGAGRRARASVGAGGRSVEVIEPLEWGTFSSVSIDVDLEREIRVDHPRLQLELRQEPFVGPIDFTTTKAVPALDEEHHTLNHYQQPVRARGSARIAGQDHPFDGFGWRDRTWGFRDESISWLDYTCLCVVVDDIAVVLYKIIDGEHKLRASGWVIDQDGQHDVGDFAFVRSGSGLLAEASAETDRGTMTFTVVDQLGGFWLPMGADRHTGPTCSAFDEFVVLRTADGRPASALCEHGIVRSVN
jgi:hypothetical protein